MNFRSRPWRKRERDRGRESEIERETISGDTDHALGHILEPGRGLRGNLDTDLGAEVRVPSNVFVNKVNEGDISQYLCLPVFMAKFYLISMSGQEC